MADQPDREIGVTIGIDERAVFPPFPVQIDRQRGPGLRIAIFPCVHGNRQVAVHIGGYL